MSNQGGQLALELAHLLQGYRRSAVKVLGALSTSLNRKNMMRKFVLVASIAMSTAVMADPIQFIDTSEKLGFTRGTETWGLGWGNLNTDKWPDIYNSGHRDFPRLYRNTGTGDFNDVAMSYDVAMDGYHINDTQNDVHGIAIADYDNDGDDDILTGDEDELFINLAESGGLLTPTVLNSNQQFAAWNDTDSDRLLESDISCPRGQYILLFDVNGDGQTNRICADEGTFPREDPTGLIPTINQANDSAMGDFNNDGLTDLVVTRGALRPVGATKIDDHHIEAWFRDGSGVEFRFQAEGPVTFRVDGDGGGIFRQELVHELDSNGVNSASGRGAAISYDTTTNEWVVRDNRNRQTYIRIEALNVVSEPVLSNLAIGDEPLPPFHGVNTPNGFVWVFNTGLDIPVSCVSVVAADFDNDMDLDLYMACRHGVSNLANRYFDNQGDGTFVEVVGHGGEGPMGAGLEFGLSDSVVTADYDVDGFIDLAVTNGLLFYPVSIGGPDSLFRNAGNDNHWIEIDLLGTVSPRAAIGAKVYVTAGGVTQLREQSGSYHRWSQNHARIHFGLGQNTEASEVRIEWPSGQVDVYANVGADKLYDATEGADLTVPELGAPVFETVAPGEECGVPPYTSTLGPAIQLWRNCGTDDWSIRAQGGLGRMTLDQIHQLVGQIDSSSPLAAANPIALGAIDSLQEVGNSTVFDISVQQAIGNNKGFNFSVAGQTRACLNIDPGSIEVLYVGAAGRRVDAPFDLVGLGECADLTDQDSDGLPDTVETGADADGDQVANQQDLDSDNDTIPDVIEAGLTDVDGDLLIDDATLAGTVMSPPDTDGDGIPDFLDAESANPLNDGTAFDITGTPNAVLDTNGDGRLDGGDVGGGFDADSDGIDDLVDSDPTAPGGGGNTRPVALAQSLSTTFETPRTITLAGTDADNDVLEYSVTSGPSNGVLTGTAPDLEYTPNSGFVGSDSFQFTAFDGLVSSLPVEISIDVSSSSTTLFCGEPSFDAGVDRGTFLWLDCGGTERWSLRITGGNTPGRLDYFGQIEVQDGVNNITEVLIEGNDVLDDSDPNRFNYQLIVFGSGIDGIDFELGLGACYTPDTTNGLPVYFGANRIELTTENISLDTGLECPVAADTDGDGLSDADEAVLGTDPLVADTDAGGVDDGTEVAAGTDPLNGADDPNNLAACGDPGFDNQTEPGLYVWLDCSAAGPDAQWQVRMVGGGLGFSEYAGDLLANQVVSATGVSIEGNDTLDSSPGDDLIDFSLFVGGSGVDGFDFTLSAGTAACFTATTLPNAVDVFVGADRTVLTDPFALETLGACNITPITPPPQAPQCGAPSFDAATDPGLYLWQDCDNTTARAWTLRAVGGGLGFDSYVGNLTASDVLSPIGFGLEPNDTLDTVAGDTLVDFELRVGGTGQDGFSVDVPLGASCFDPTSLPAGAGLFVGRDQLVMTGSFNLEDLGVCQ